MTGKVWLVGAGPGDAGLLTIRGKQVLEQAEVVVYDALVGTGVLQYIPKEARIIFAGKRSGNHYLKQSETNKVLLDEALKGHRVVRLKGGDPFLFGRGGEELELLVENGVPFEIVPGITSAFAVPAYQGIPVTHRDFCSSVHIITGHKRAGHEYDIDFDALVRSRGTLIFLMGIAAMPDIIKGLTDAGMDPGTPAAVLEKGTTAAQRRITAKLNTLEEECRRQNVQTPAIIVVGPVCALADTFSWYEKRPLAGVSVIVTRPKESVSGLSAMLREKGAEVLELPAIETVPIDKNERLIEALKGFSDHSWDWVVFTSPAGVRIFMEKLLEDQDVRVLAGTKIAVIGQGTQKALIPFGLKPDFIPSVYDGATLGKELAEVCGPGERILIPRASIGNKALTEALDCGKGLCVTDLPIYDTVYTSSGVIDEKALLESGQIDFAVFTSASTVKGFTAGIGDMDYSGVKAVCIGKQTEAAAKAFGMKTFTAEKATLESLTDCVEKTAAALKKMNQH